MGLVGSVTGVGGRYSPRNITSYIDLCDTSPVAYFNDRLLYHVSGNLKVLGDNATIGERIRYYRTKAAMRGDVLAGMLGVSRSLITMYEHGHSAPGIDEVKRIAQALGIEPDTLYDDYYRFLAYPCSEAIKCICTERQLKSAELGAMLGVTSVTVNCWKRGQHAVNREIRERLKSLNLL